MPNKIFAGNFIGSCEATELSAELSERFVAELTAFKAHNLGDFQESDLLERVDRKYVVPTNILSELLLGIKPFYSVLSINGYRVLDYENVYFDTGAFDLYRAHHNGKLNRYKVRHRYYSESDTAYMEVKYKNSKKRISKKRILSVRQAEQAIGESNKFLHKCGVSNVASLVSTQLVKYKRIAMTNRVSNERISIDIALNCGKMDTDRQIWFGDYAIIEVKQPRLNRTSPFIRMMKSYGFKTVSFSKYCIGLCVLYGGQLKANRFKDTFKYINSIAV